MQNIGQTERTHWNVWTLPMEWKNHLQHMCTEHCVVIHSFYYYTTGKS